MNDNSALFSSCLDCSSGLQSLPTWLQDVLSGFMVSFPYALHHLLNYWHLSVILIQSAAQVCQWKRMFLYFVLGIWSLLFSLLTASLMCLGWSGGVSPHFSQTSRAVKAKTSWNYNSYNLVVWVTSVFLNPPTNLPRQFPQQRPLQYQTWQ